MKKYKLIKEYPGSPKIGYEISFSPENDYECARGWNLELIYRKLLADNPEFWEEVKELEYEVLSYLLFDRVFNLSTREECRDPQDQKGTYYRCKDSSFINTTSMHILNPNPKIHSIKRLSDGEIFTIGDKLIEGVINDFIIEDESIIYCNLDIDNHSNTGIYRYLPLHNWIKAKQPLFTTEDGVEIFKGDKFYFVTIVDNKKPYRTSGIWEVCKPTIGFVYEPEYEKYFSTKEAAEEYILMNKPCLSFNDVLKNVIIARGLDDLSQIKQLVKSKLNGK